MNAWQHWLRSQAASRTESAARRRGWASAFKSPESESTARLSVRVSSVPGQHWAARAPRPYSDIDTVAHSDSGGATRASVDTGTITQACHASVSHRRLLGRVAAAGGVPVIPATRRRVTSHRLRAPSQSQSSDSDLTSRLST